MPVAVATVDPLRRAGAVLGATDSVGLSGQQRVGERGEELSGAVASLTREHMLISTQVDKLVARVTAPDAIEDVDRIRGVGTALLGRTVRHRQRGSDIAFEAYEFDIGGET